MCYNIHRRCLKIALSKENNKRHDFNLALAKFEGKTVSCINYDKHEVLEIVFTDGSMIKSAPIKKDNVGIRLGVSIRTITENSI
jgi:hypothetical protein